jgi:hypothetical protein
VSALPFVIAHAGHALVDLSVFLGPVVLLLAAVKIAGWRERRREGKRTGS